MNTTDGLFSGPQSTWEGEAKRQKARADALEREVATLRAVNEEQAKAIAAVNAAFERVEQ